MDEINNKDDKFESSEEQNITAEDEEEEEYEMLDVLHDKDNSDSGEESSGNSSPKNEKIESLERQSHKPIQKSNHNSKNTEEKKVLNSLAQTPSTSTPSTNSSKATVLQKKGITMKKANAELCLPAHAKQHTQHSFGNYKSSVSNKGNCVNIIESPKTLTLSESIKRKLNDDSSAGLPQFKKIQIGHAPSQTANKILNSPNKTINMLEPKSERENLKSAEDISTHRINVITIPANPCIDILNGSMPSAGDPNSSKSPPSGDPPIIKGEILDYDGDNIANLNSSIVNGKTETASLKEGNIINFGNFDNSLPPIFFKNLCNSTRHEALGLYVANIMNRLSDQYAVKLEMKILKSIIDVQGEEHEQIKKTALH